MNGLRIKSPVNSVEAAQAQIRAGADDLYVGLASSGSLGFSARGHTARGRSSAVSAEDLARIVSIAHSSHVTVELAANVPLLMNDMDGSRQVKEEYLRHVEEGLQLGVDAVIVGDLGNLRFLRERGITAPLVASTLLGATNRHHVALLAQMGASKVVLPHHNTPEELAALVAASPVPLEVFGHFGCSFLEAGCSLFHELSESISVGIPCRARWRNVETGEVAPFTDLAEDCALCLLGELEQLGVHGVKIIGRELDPRHVASITSLYAQARAHFRNGLSAESVRLGILTHVPRWREMCDARRCKLRYCAHYT